MKKLILFDIDGTLLMTNGAGKNALYFAFREVFEIENPKVDVDFGGRTDRSLARELFSINGIELSDKNILTLYESYLAKLADALSKSNAYLLPGVLELVSELHKHADIAIGLLTGNIRQGAYMKLAHLEIDEYFKFGGFGDDHESRDEIARSGVAQAEQYLGKSFSSADVFVIGDTPHDVSCSRAIGAKSIAVTTGYASKEAILAEKPDIIVEDLSNKALFMDIFLGNRLI